MGLYDDEKIATTSGDILDVAYWQTKFAALKLEAALKSRQPEGAIRCILPDVINGCSDVLKTYPNHEDVKKWRDNALNIQKKIDPNAPPADFRLGFAQWRDYSYEAGWRFYNLAKMAAAAADWTWAQAYAADAGKQFARTVDRMSDWPSEVQEWVKSARNEMQELEERKK